MTRLAVDPGNAVNAHDRPRDAGVRQLASCGGGHVLRQVARGFGPRDDADTERSVGLVDDLVLPDVEQR